MSTLSEAAAAAAPTPPASVGAGRAIRLVVMMMLEFLVQGSWFATVGLMLATNGLPTIIGTTFTLAAVAAIISPMFLGALADRFFPSQQVLGVAHAINDVIPHGRGSVVAIEISKDIRFNLELDIPCRRYFLISDVRILKVDTLLEE